MSGITRLISVVLDGEPPPSLNLRPLSGYKASADLVVNSFRPFTQAPEPVRWVQRYEEFEKIEPELGTAVVYLVGHGWTDERGQFMASMRKDAGSVLLSGEELVKRLNQCIHPGSQVILLSDTCEAATLRGCLQDLNCKDMTALFASERGEQAWNLVPDGTTRFALEVSRALGEFSRARAEFDIVELAAKVKGAIEKESMGYHQTVTYRVQGDQVRLCSLAPADLKQQRVKTFRRIRNRLIAVGGVLVGLLFLFGIYWHGHIVVTVTVGDIAQIADSAMIEIYEVDPDQNRLDLIKRVPVNGQTSVWYSLPATNLLVTFNASYVDGRERAIRFHKIFQPGLTNTKTHRFVLPSADEILQRPGMAYISADRWMQGNPKKEVPGLAPFWIDIAPPTIQEYFPFLYELYKTGRIEPNESMLVWHLMNKADLSDEDFRRTTSPSALLGLIKGKNTLFDEPSCPAPMTEREARLYLKSIGKRLPSSDQWEVAARGVDGRIYPWGNRKDDDRINAGLPTKVGWEGRQKLRPVREHPESISPFGLFDTVGNAGDWVEDEGVELAGGEVRGIGFKGGVFQFNAEDWTTYSFLRLPNAEVDLLAARGFWMITSRGVIPGR